MPDFTIEDAAHAMATALPPCVRELGIQVVAVEGSRATLRMGFADRICREGSAVSGQALAALADTAMLFALWSAAGRRRDAATVDLHVTYLRGVRNSDVVAQAEVVRLGKSMAFARVSMIDAASGACAATAVGTFALSQQ